MLRLSEEVRLALAERRPVVALESTILAHGLPWPENLEVGRALEAAVRAGGAVPATVAVVAGEPRLGLDEATLERVAREGARFVKAGASDLAPLLARGADAATTVSATAFLAARAGVRVFATGGIGGVHRGAQADVSSDLGTLAREPVVVISAGAKAILDLPRTVEMLETLGVLVLGYRTAEFPAFYTPSSGIRLEHRVDSAVEAARVVARRFALGQGGVLLVQPVPAEAALAPEAVYPAIDAALARAEAQGVRGKALTPFLLAELARATGGAAVRANRALALANAGLGAELAVELERAP
jgi:pseudouridine-5'-phosphate glycosidase